MEPVVVYHNESCSKSRGVLDILAEHDVEVDVISYLTDPPSAARIRELCEMLDLRPRDLLRTNEPAYADRGLDDPALSDDVIIEAMVDAPILIQRPIVVVGDRAVIGRPPERALELLV